MSARGDKSARGPAFDVNPAFTSTLAPIKGEGSGRRRLG